MSFSSSLFSVDGEDGEDDGSDGDGVADDDGEPELEEDPEHCQDELDLDARAANNRCSVDGE